MRYTIMKKWNKLSGKEKRLFLESFFYSLWVPFMSLLPLKFYYPLLGIRGGKLVASLESDQTIILIIKTTLSRCRKYLPWAKKCLTQAIVAKLMLRKRKIDAIMYLGVAKKNDQLKAHAWVVCNDIIVTGASDYSQFSPVEWFV
jgi:hypothetical protein